MKPTIAAKMVSTTVSLSNSSLGRCLLVLLLTLSLSAFGCDRGDDDRKGPMEKAGEKADQGIENAAKQVDEMGERSMEKTTRTMGEAVEEQGEEMQEQGEAMQEQGEEMQEQGEERQEQGEEMQDKY